jgi:hypothetical protein
MKQRNTFFLAMAVLVVISALFRLIPSDMRPLGFAPQIAIALFGGALITDKKYAFALPLLSMFISDVIFELLHINGLSNIGGFYSGQLINYAILSLKRSRFPMCLLIRLSLLPFILSYPISVYGYQVEVFQDLKP